MAAKKNIIKELRQEIKDLEYKLTAAQHHQTYRERQFKRIQNTHEHELALINQRTNNIATTLKYRFTKELTWMVLCDDPDNKLRYIKDAIERLRYIAAPVEDFDDD